MDIKGVIGRGVSNFLSPYMQISLSQRGADMPKRKDNDYKLKEYYLWYQGDEELLVDFYQNLTSGSGTIDTKASYYYANVNSETRLIHSGLPGSICEAMSNLATQGGFISNVEKGDVIDDDATERLNNILTDNSITALLKQSVTDLSWGKAFSWKISFDKELTKYPIVEEVNALNFEVIKKRNRNVGYIYKEYLYSDKDKFELNEIYGYGIIDYKLFKISKSGEKKEVSLLYLEDTKHLQKITFSKDVILAGVCEKSKSDFKGLVSEFDNLDEMSSQYADEIRTSKTETYIPEILAPKGNFNRLKKNFIVSGTDMNENGKNEIKSVQPSLRATEHIIGIESVRDHILAMVRLSPLTLGYQGNIGANSSGEALNKREVVSLRTRDDIIELLEPFMEQMFIILLVAEDIAAGKTGGVYETNVIFGEYVAPDRAELIENTAKLIEFDIIDREKAIDEVYGEDISEDEKNRMLANIGELTETIDNE